MREREHLRPDEMDLLIKAAGAVGRYGHRDATMSVDTLGLVLRVLVTAASLPEREGGKQVLKQVKQMGKGVSRLHTIWTDGGFDGEPFLI